MSITHLQSPDSDGPLVASPKQAMKRLQISRSTLYALLNTGDLESYTQGRSRRVRTWLPYSRASIACTRGTPRHSGAHSRAGHPGAGALRRRGAASRTRPRRRPPALRPATRRPGGQDRPGGLAQARCRVWDRAVGGVVFPAAWHAGHGRAHGRQDKGSLLTETVTSRSMRSER